MPLNTNHQFSASEACFNNIICLAGNFTVYIRTLQLHIAVTLVRGSSSNCFNEGFAASGQSVEEEGLYLRLYPGVRFSVLGKQYPARSRWPLLDSWSTTFVVVRIFLEP